MEILEPFLPAPSRRKDGRGRPWKQNRAVLNGIPWILRTGAPWADLPRRYPLYQTCHRRFQQWVRCGVLHDVLKVLAEALHHDGYLDLRETSSTVASHLPRKVGHVSKTKRGKGSKIMAIADLIAPHRSDRKRRTQDGRPLRRYRRRWKMERLFAWLQNYRRIVVRYERYPENFLGKLDLA